ncbi:MAG: NAD(P)-dependent oxidoreductase [Microbacteriaceae bacterium]|nr:NAD(P)-dependent oxidoreductase [Microbacteriaceae bacterium]
MGARTTVGLCGLGNMGLAVAQRLATAYDVTAFDLSAERKELAGKVENVTTVDALNALASVDVVVLSLPTPNISLDVCGQLAGILPQGALVVETSTTTPRHLAECSRVLAGAGMSIIDAAILSGVGQMESGEATLLVGGAGADLGRADGLLHVLGAKVEQFGALGTGMAAKVVNNAVAHAVMVVLVEAVALAAASGIDLEKIGDMLRAPDGGLIRPLTHRIEERVATANYEGGMPLAAARKDSTLALEMAQANGIPLFAIQSAHSVYEIALSQGLGRLDYAALATLWEGWSGTSLAYRKPSEPSAGS